MHSQIKTDSIADHSSRILHRTRDPINGIDVECLQMRDSLQVLLHVHSIPLPASENRELLVKFSSGEKTTSYLATLRKGEQTLLASPALKEALFHAFEQGENVILSCGSYQESLSPFSASLLKKCKVY